MAASLTLLVASTVALLVAQPTVGAFLAVGALGINTLAMALRERAK